ncbi:MAG: hypothetical protein ACLFUS_06040 [Candidatus Sumerlaeia bacterium]
MTEPKTRPKPGSERRSPNYGGRLGYGIFEFVLRHFGVIPAYVMLAFVAPYYVIFRYNARKSAAPFLRHRFPERGSVWRFFATIYYFYRFGQVLIDQGVMGVLGPEHFHVDFPGEDELYRRAQQRKGMILLTTHAGAWQYAMANMRNLEVPVSFQFKKEEHTEGRHFFDMSGESEQFHLIDPDGFLGGMVEMTNALSKGEIVSVMGDRAWGAQTMDAEFLGEKAAFPLAAYHLAHVTGAELVALLTVRTGRLSYRIEAHYLSENLDREGRSRAAIMEQLLGAYVTRLEQYLKKHPFLWFNFFDFWANSKETEEKR